jgi:hypothetical protein
MISWRSKTNLKKKEVLPLSTVPPRAATPLLNNNNNNNNNNNDDAPGTSRTGSCAPSFNPKASASVKARTEIFTTIALPHVYQRTSAILNGNVIEHYGTVIRPVVSPLNSGDDAAAASGAASVSSSSPEEEPASRVVIICVASATINSSANGVLDKFLTVTDKDAHEFATFNSKVEDPPSSTNGSGSRPSSRTSNYDEGQLLLKNGNNNNSNNTNPTRIVSIYRKMAEKKRRKSSLSMPSFSPSSFSSPPSSPSFHLKRAASPVSPPSSIAGGLLPLTETRLLQRFTVLHNREVEQVNGLRKVKGLSQFPVGNILVEFDKFNNANQQQQQEVQPAERVGLAARYEERGFLVLTPAKFDQTDVSLTVEITLDKDDVSSPSISSPAV